MATNPPDASPPRDVQAELAELRRRIAELEHVKQQSLTQAPIPVKAMEARSSAASSDDLSATLSSFVRRAAMILQAEKCAILLYEADTNELVAQHPALKFTDDEVNAFRVSADRGLSATVFRSGEAIICQECADDPRCREDGLQRFHAHNALTVPMVVEHRNEHQQVVDTTHVGVIHAFNKRFGRKFAAEDIDLLTVLARNAAAIISTTRANLNEALEKKQLEYTLLSMTAGLLVVGRNKSIQVVNETVARLLDLDREADIGRSYEQAIANEEIRAFFTEALNRDEGLAQDFRIGDRTYQGQTDAVRNERGMPIGILCIFNDVTELRNVERMKTDFVSTVSHELRTPLTSIKGFIRTLLDDPTGEYYDQDLRMEFYNIIDTECDRLIRLISDLLNVSRIERGLPLHVNYAEVDVAALVTKCLNFHRGYTVNHELIANLPADLPVITADRDKLDEILSNLIGNAIKYSPDGGEITIAVTDEGDRLRFAVSDHGLGIPPEHLEKVFQRFHRVHGGDSQRVGGTGLGLFLAKSLVEAHGGVIWVDSTVGEGSTFNFTIPRQPRGEAES